MLWYFPMLSMVFLVKNAVEYRPVCVVGCAESTIVFVAKSVKGSFAFAVRLVTVFSIVSAL
jgi:hypothetical protein